MLQRLLVSTFIWLGRMFDQQSAHNLNLLLRMVERNLPTLNRDALRDPRTNEPILIYDAGAGAYVRSARQTSNALRVDWLFSYRPAPGTVVFAGYGSSLTEPDAFTFRGLSRTNDAFFVKLSYLFSW